MKKLLIIFLLLFFSFYLVSAVDFTPQGNINLRNFFNITNGNYINANFFVGDGSQITGVIAQGNNVSFNQSLTDGLYAPISAGNSSFNQSLTDSLYLKDNSNLALGNYNGTFDWVFAQLNWSWLQNIPTYVKDWSFKLNASDEPNLNVNSSNYWDNLNTQVDLSITESQISDLVHTVDTNQSDVQINTLIDNRVIQSFITALGFVSGPHTSNDEITLNLLNITGIDDNACTGTDKINNVTFDNGLLSITCSADISAGSPAPNTTTITYQNVTTWPVCSGTDKLTADGSTLTCATDQTSAGGGDGTGGWTNDSIQTNTSFNVNIQNGANLTVYEVFSNSWGNLTALTDTLYADIIWAYNQTDPANTYTDGQIAAVNTTANIESLNFVQGAHTVDTTVGNNGITLVEANITDLQNYVVNDTAGWTLNFTKIFSLDWLNVTILKSQILNSGTLSFDWTDSEVSNTLTIGTSSTVSDGALSSNVVLLNADQVFTGANNFTSNTTYSNNTRTFYGDENQGEIYWDSANSRLVIKVS